MRVAGRSDEIRTDGTFEGEPRVVRGENSSLAAFQWGILEHLAGRKARSIDWMRRAVSLGGDDYWYHYFLAFILDDAGLMDEALEHYNIAAALEPSSPYVLYSRARLSRKKGKWREALDDFKVCARVLEGPARGAADPARVRRPLPVAGPVRRARDRYTCVIRGDSHDDLGRSARLNCANIDADSGKTGPALAEYNELLGENAADAEARHSRAILELRDGRAASAERDLDVLLSIGKPSRQERVEYLSERAQARLLLGRKAGAMADAVERDGFTPARRTNGWYSGPSWPPADTICCVSTSRKSWPCCRWAGSGCARTFAPRISISPAWPPGGTARPTAPG